MPAVFDFDQRVAGNMQAKGKFHREARRCLKELAVRLHLPEGSFEIRTNRGGNAVSGEVTLQGEQVYVQAGQYYSEGKFCLLFRRCRNRSDYTGGPNCWTPLWDLNEPARLAGIIKRRLCL